MKTITIRELHANTGDWVRRAAWHGEILVTDQGHPVARIIPEQAPLKMEKDSQPYFANRKLLPEFAAFLEREARRGPVAYKVTEGISEDRDDR